VRARPLVWVLSAWTLAISLACSALPLNRFPSLNADVPGGVFNYLSVRFHIRVSELFPLWQRQDTIDYIASAAWLALAAVFVWWVAGRVRMGSVVLAAAMACAAAAPLAHVNSPKMVYRQQITSSVGSLRAIPGQRIVIPVQLKNPGRTTWSTARGMALSYRWVSGGANLPIEGLRTHLPRDIGPGESAAMTMTVEAPPQPGEYELRISLVHEAVVWFLDVSGEFLSITVRVSVT
jgi:hypothetical protein